MSVLLVLRSTSDYTDMYCKEKQIVTAEGDCYLY